MKDNESIYKIFYDFKGYFNSDLFMFLRKLSWSWNDDELIQVYLTALRPRWFFKLLFSIPFVRKQMAGIMRASIESTGILIYWYLSQKGLEIKSRNNDKCESYVYEVPLGHA